MPTIGGRKLCLGILYLLGCFVVFETAVLTGAKGWDVAALVSIPTSLATGLGVIVWGYNKEYAAKNGNQ